MAPIWRVDELGRWLPKNLRADRERRMEEMAEARETHVRAAINEACVGERRDAIGRALYHGPVSLEVWPTLQPLTPAERTMVMAAVRRIRDLPEKMTNRERKDRARRAIEQGVGRAKWGQP